MAGLCLWAKKQRGIGLGGVKECKLPWFGSECRRSGTTNGFPALFRTEKWRENLPALISGPGPGARGAGPVQVGYCKSIFCLNAHKAKPWLKGAPGLAKRIGMAAPGHR